MRLEQKQEELRKRHDWVRSVISRPAQYHRFMMVDFENLKIIHDYRTASALRGFGLVFLTIGPILLGPLVRSIVMLHLPANILLAVRELCSSLWLRWRHVYSGLCEVLYPIGFTAY